jgi:hypothetical protein
MGKLRQGRKSKRSRVVEESDDMSFPEDPDKIFPIEDSPVEQTSFQIVSRAYLAISLRHSKIFTNAYPSQIESVMLAINIFLFFVFPCQVNLSSV